MINLRQFNDTTALGSKMYSSNMTSCRVEFNLGCPIEKRWMDEMLLRERTGTLHQLVKLGRNLFWLFGIAIWFKNRSVVGQRFKSFCHGAK